MSYSQDQPEDGLSPVASLIKALRKWVILEPTIMLFLMSARMVYFTRLNLFLDVVCREMKNLTCDNLTQVQSHHTYADKSQCQCSAPLPSPEPEGPCSPGGGGADLHGAQDREHRPHPPLRPQRPRARGEAAAGEGWRCVTLVLLAETHVAVPAINNSVVSKCCCISRLRMVKNINFF